MVTAPDRRELVGWMRTQGLSERRALSIVQMSPNLLRYVRVLMELAGHKHLSTTQRYIDVNDQMLKEAVELL